jgi:hypothetical protein
MAAHGSRSILGPVNPYENGLPPVNYVDGGDDSLSARQPYTAPLSVTDQTSAETRAERDGLQDAHKQAQSVASQFVSDGAAGSQIGRGPDTFSRLGTIADADGAGPGDVIAPDPVGLHLRAEGGDGLDGSAYGKAIG